MTTNTCTTPVPGTDLKLRIPVLVALASALQLSESLIPLPLPGVKLGLANLVTIIALVTAGFRVSLAVAALRCLVSSLVLGSFLSPGFVLSLAGSVSAALVMGLAYIANRRLALFSVLGISVLGALAHNLAQTGVVYLLFAGNAGMLWLLPLMLLSGAGAGALTGRFAARVLGHLDDPREAVVRGEIPVPAERRSFPGIFLKDSPLRRVGPGVKLAVFAAVVVAGFWTGDPRALAALCAGTFAAALLAGVPFPRILGGIRRLFPLLAVLFVTNVLFMPGGASVGRGFFTFHADGAVRGILSCLRLLAPFLAALAVTAATRPDEMLRGLEKIFAPLKAAGVDTGAAARALGQSWALVFPLLDHVQGSFRGLFARGKGRSFRGILAAASAAVAALLVHLSDEEHCAAFLKQGDA